MKRSTLIMIIAIIVVSMPSRVHARIDKRSTTNCSTFISYTEIGDLLQSYQDTYPAIARAFSLGKSVENRELWALKLSANPDVEEAEPEIRIIGAIHGNECISADMVLKIIDMIVSGYGDEGPIDDLVDGTEMIFVPLVNPDGYVQMPWADRENANLVDLNRNLGYGWVDNGVNGGDYPFSEPETKALRDAAQDATFSLGLSYHTNAMFVCSTWNYSPHHPLDEVLFQAIGDSYAETSGYGVTFGWDWYQITGDVNDWSLGTEGTFDWTLELDDDHNMKWFIHEPGVSSFLAWSLVGIEGLVTNPDGEPVAARITVSPEGEPIFNDPDVGDYHRILLPGVYDITAEANGFAPVTIKDVVVPESGTVIVDIELSPQTNYSAFRVNRMILPQVIANHDYEDENGIILYMNTTRPTDTLGPSDGIFYSLSPTGSITLDMGEGTPVVDIDGVDLQVISGTESYDPIKVLISNDQDGPFVKIATGNGTLEVDIISSGLSEARYVRIIDIGNGPFNDKESGYDLDAIVNISLNITETIDGGVDSGTKIDPDTNPVDGSTDNNVDGGTSNPENNNPSLHGVAGCDCQIIYGQATSILSLLF